MRIVDFFDEQGKTLNEVIETYIVATLPSIIYNKKNGLHA